LTHSGIQQAFINGKPLTKPWFTHDDMINGSTLELEMGGITEQTMGKQPG
jgi:putative alpha-1,2-mannosidase